LWSAIEQTIITLDTKSVDFLYEYNWNIVESGVKHYSPQHNPNPITTDIFVLYRAIAIPETIRQLEGPNQLDRRVTRFVVPLCAAIGRCGSCIYISISCLFVMQITDQEVDVASVILVMWVFDLICLLDFTLMIMTKNHLIYITTKSPPFTLWKEVLNS
jgi:hypothetical protein